MGEVRNLFYSHDAGRPDVKQGERDPDKLCAERLWRAQNHGQPF